MFTAIRGDDEWLKRYLPDSHNSQIGNVPNRVEITTEDGEERYRIRIPYLDQFYNTEVYLIGKCNDAINALRGRRKRNGVCENPVDTIQLSGARRTLKK